MEEGETGEEGEWDEVQDVGEKESRDTREGSEGKGGDRRKCYKILYNILPSQLCGVFPPSIKSSIKHYGCALAA